MEPLPTFPTHHFNRSDHNNDGDVDSRTSVAPKITTVSLKIDLPAILSNLKNNDSGIIDFSAIMPATRSDSAGRKEEISN